MKNDIVLASLSMDLKRVALAYHRHSYTMANRFLREALLRKKELEMATVKPYLRTILKQIEPSKVLKPNTAEDFLMYSTLIQNAVMANKFKNFPPLV